MELSGLKYEKILNPKALILEQTIEMRMKIGSLMMKILIQKSLMLIGEKFKSQKGRTQAKPRPFSLSLSRSFSHELFPAAKHLPSFLF